MKPEEQDRDDALREIPDVASCTECTGLMPALPMDAAADASSASLYGIHAAKGARKRQYRRK